MKTREKAEILKRISVATALCGLAFFSACGVKLVPFTDISPAQAAAMIEQKGSSPRFVVLDVRTAEEFAESRIAEALNLDIKKDDFKEKVEKLDRKGVYLVYCRGGGRSARAMKLMKDWGFKRVFNLQGGVLNWEKEKLALEYGAGERKFPSP